MTDRSDRWLLRWLSSVCLLIAAMVAVGGATRLTNSGLSITEWRPVVGALPPLNEEQWLEAFEKYKLIPEYRVENSKMTLDGFKVIYYWEFAHRNLGRLTGIAVLVPLLFFWVGGRLSRVRALKVLFGASLIGVQGGLGWYMVRSGLADRIDVSPFRLAAHLGLAFGILWYFLRLRIEWSEPRETRPAARRPVGFGILLLRIFLGLQILLGALTAGLKAGFSYNTFPDMNGEWFPTSHVESPWWIHVWENSAIIQFFHRWVGLGIFFGSIGVWVADRRSRAGSRALWVVPLIAGLQVATGIACLIFVVPIPVALVHQAGALALFVALAVLKRPAVADVF